MDRATGTPVRYEYPDPGGLVHVDVKKLGNIPAGGGWRKLGRAQGGRNHSADKSSGRFGRNRNPLRGPGFIHAAVDDHSRLAYCEIHDDQTRQTAAAFWGRAHAWFAGHGITVQRVLTDNGGCYRSLLWRDTLAELGVTHLRTRPYRPQTNGKVCEGLARRCTGPAWLHRYNHHRPHTALGGQAPITRCTNVPGPNN